MNTLLGVRPHIRTVAQGAGWLVNKHEKLRALCERVGAVTDGRVDLQQIREAVVADDTHRKRWAAYEAKSPMPFDEDRMDAWLKTGPQPTDEALIVGRMTMDEVGQLRLVATLAPRNYPIESVSRVGFAIDDWCTFDVAGLELVRDYLHVIRCVFDL